METSSQLASNCSIYIHIMLCGVLNTVWVRNSLVTVANLYNCCKGKCTHEQSRRVKSRRRPVYCNYSSTIICMYRTLNGFLCTKPGLVKHREKNHRDVLTQWYRDKVMKVLCSPKSRAVISKAKTSTRSILPKSQTEEHFKLENVEAQK